MLTAISSLFLCINAEISNKQLEELVAAQSQLTSIKSELKPAQGSRDPSQDISILHSQVSESAGAWPKSSRIQPQNSPVLHSSTHYVLSALDSNYTLYSLPINRSDYLALLQSALEDISNTSKHNKHDATGFYAFNTSSWTFHVTTIKEHELKYMVIEDIIKRYIVLAQQDQGTETRTRVGVVEVDNQSVADVLIYSSLQLPPTDPLPTAFDENTGILPNGTVLAVTYTDDTVSTGLVPFNVSFLDSYAPFDNTTTVTNPKRRRTEPIEVRTGRSIRESGSPFTLTVHWATGSTGMLARARVSLFIAAIEGALDWLTNQVALHQANLVPTDSAWVTLQGGCFHFNTGRVIFQMWTTISQRGTNIPQAPGAQPEMPFELQALTWHQLANMLLNRLHDFRPNENIYAQFGRILFNTPDGQGGAIGSWNLLVNSRDEL